MRKALVLDFGGVISRTLFETHHLSERALGLAPGTLRWKGPFDLETDPLWRSMQDEEISERDYWRTRTREVGDLTGHGWTEMHEFVRAARGAAPADVIRPEALTTFEIARENGIRLAILSNELDLFYGADFRDKLSFLTQFEVIVDATHTGILKPDPRAYSAVTEAMALAPSDCVFVDDQIRNISGAEAARMIPIHFDVRAPRESYDRALAALELTERLP